MNVIGTLNDEVIGTISCVFEGNNAVVLARGNDNMDWYAIGDGDGGTILVNGNSCTSAEGSFTSDVEGYVQISNYNTLAAYDVWNSFMSSHGYTFIEKI